MDLLQKSKTLGYILRHNSQDFDIELDKQGRARVQDILKVMNITEEELQNIVEYGEKTRYVIEGEYVRALHGHSIKNVHIQLQKLEGIETVYHGTKAKNMSLIEEQGIIPMNRMFVHLSPTEKDAKIVADRRKGQTVVLAIDVKPMEAENYEIFITDNGTILSNTIPWKFITGVTIF